MGANDPLVGTVSDSGDMIGRIYGKLNNTYQCCILNIKALGLVVSEMKIFFFFFFFFFIIPFFMGDNDGPGQTCVDTRDTVGRIYKEEYHTLLHTKYESSGSCGFRDVFPL